MTAKSILFLHSFGPEMATFRYRSLFPAQELKKINGFSVGLNEEGDYDIVIVSKVTEADIPIAEQAKKDGAKVVMDCADDHFNHSTQGALYHRMAGLADHLVTATSVMRDRVHRYTGKDAAVIPDPYEQPEVAPHADGDKMIWFGHRTNIPDLMAVRHLLDGRQLYVATGPTAPQGIQPTWGPGMLKQALEASNIALLPTREGAEYKSPNRLLNAIRAGVFPICQQHPSYMEFRPFVWVGNFHAGLRWTDAFREDLNECVAAAQDYIRDRYSVQAVGRKWADFLESV